MIQRLLFAVSLAVLLFMMYELPALMGDGYLRLLPTGMLAGLVLLGGIVWAVVWPRLLYETWQYELRTEELYLERGIVTRIKTVVPLRRVQHLDVSQNVLEREFDLGRLVVYTAGTMNSTVVVPGLLYEDAEALRNEIRHFVVEDAV